MKKVLLFLLTFVTAGLFAQGFNYKALITDSNGLAVSNQNVVVRFSILNGANTTVYQETHNVSTDANGILSVNVGEGTVVAGDFTMIDWGGDTYFLKTEIDLNDGNGWQDFGTTEFKYVPYAKYAETGDYRGLTHKPGVWYSSVTYNPATNSTEDIYRTGMVVIGNIGNSLPSNISRAKLYVYDDQMTGRSALMSVNYEGTDNTDKMGEYIRMAGDVSTKQYGAYYELSTTGSGELYGEKVDLTSANDANHYGMEIEMNGSGAGNHTGQNIRINTGGTGNCYGSNINMINAGTGNQTGQNIYIQNNNNNSSVSGEYIRLDVQGSGDQAAIKTLIDAYGTGTTSGIHNVINIHSSGNIVANFTGIVNAIQGNGTGVTTGVENFMFSPSSDIQIGTSNRLTNNGDGVRMGTKNYIDGTGLGAKYGTFNWIPATAGGNYHFAVYGVARKVGANIYAGYFDGSVMVTRKLKGPDSGDNDMKAYVYGDVLQLGSVDGTRSTDGFSASRIGTGHYRVTFSNSPSGNYIVIVTKSHTVNPRMVSVAQYDDYFDVYIYDAGGTAIDGGFNFVVYKK